MNRTSPFLLVKQLEGDILRLLSGVDVVDFSNAEQQELMLLRNNLVDARLEIQDYELAETRDFQIENAKTAKEYLTVVQSAITKNSANIFGPVDVAHLTAYIEQILDNLR